MVNTPCAGDDARTTLKCLNIIRTLFSSDDLFWFGKIYPSLCPSYRRPLDISCYKRPLVSDSDTHTPIRNQKYNDDSILTLLFQPGQFNVKKFDRYLNVSYQSPPGEYKACGNIYKEKKQPNREVNPSMSRFFTPWQMRGKPSVHWQQFKSDPRHYTVMFYDSSSNTVNGLYTNIVGKDLTISTEVIKYHGPASFRNFSSPFVIMLFLQQHTIDVSADWRQRFRKPIYRFLFNFTTEYDLIGPVAVNWGLASTDLYATELNRVSNVVDNCPRYVARVFLPNHYGMGKHQHLTGYCAMKERARPTQIGEILPQQHYIYATPSLSCLNLAYVLEDDREINNVFFFFSFSAPSFLAALATHKRPFIPPRLLLTVGLYVSYNSHSITYHSCCTEYKSNASVVFLNPLANGTARAVDTRTGVQPDVTISFITIDQPQNEEFKRSLFTLVMVDPDIPEVYHALGNSTYPLIHWMTINIVGKDLSTGEELFPYIGPLPPDEKPHFYYFILLKQNQRLQRDDLNGFYSDCGEDFKGRCLFRMRQFIQSRGLVFAGANWMVTQNDKYVRGVYLSQGSSPDEVCKGAKHYRPGCSDTASLIPPATGVFIVLHCFIVFLIKDIIC
ncbi:hypothetical protein Ahia01_001241800 [Argonauta hians]